jgi:hypothetical protein
MKKSVAVAGLLTGFFLSGIALAQSIASAQLSGTVRDPKGAAVTNATITVRDASRNLERVARSNSNGDYQFLQLPPGQYSVTVEAQGFAKYTAQSVRLTVGQTAELPVTLSISSTEVLDVSAETDVVETQRTSSTHTVQQLRIENLPTNGRNYINFVLTDSNATRDVAPSIGAAPTSGINFGGQRARSNLVNVDGADAVDNSVNGIRSTVSQEAVQEFQIIDNSYAPEYGRAAGGVVNIITRSGTNNFHGSAYGYLRSRYIQATNPFSNVDQPAYTRVQPGFTFGGPLKKDKAFFFLAWEGTFRQETGFSTIGANNFGLVPLANPTTFGLPAGSVVTPAQASFLATAPISPFTVAYAQLAAGGAAVAVRGTPGAAGPLGAFPTTGAPLPASFVPLVSLVGNYPVKEHTNVYSLRLDDHLAKNHQLMLRLNVSPSDVTGIQVNAQNQNFGQNAFSRTSTQNYHDVAGTAQHTWVIGDNKVNEFRFQYARRGLRYDFSRGPGGSNVAVNIPGFAFFGREPFSFVDRVEQRYQFTDNFSVVRGRHNLKFGADINHLPIRADFTVNFGGLYNFGVLTGSQVSPAFTSFPGFSPVQAYGLGLPQSFVQGVGNPHDSFTNTPLGFFAQDSWHIRPNLTLNYGVRYDVELTPTFAAVNAISQTAQDALGITQGIPRDTNNVAPRIGIAWDPHNDGKTVVRASYGLFYDHPLLALAFDSDVADGSQAPQIVLFGASPCNPAAPPSPANALNLNATNGFQGLLDKGNCLSPGLAAGLQYISAQQRFNGAPQTNSPSLFVNQNYLTAGVPLISQPFGFPTAKSFVYAYSEQADLSIEHDFGRGYSLTVGYNFNGGRHLNRPINANPTVPKALIENWERANSWAIANAQPTFSSPLTISTCNVGPAGPFIPPALLSFFRPSGLNPSLAAVFAPCLGLANILATSYHLGLGVPIPFSDMIANYSSGSSVYHGLSTNFRKRFSNRYEFLASYTWSHTIDDSTDLQSLLEPQDNFHPDQERASSTFDQRHRFVFSGVYQSGNVGSEGVVHHLFSDWTVAPLVELSSGRPFNILVGADQNFDFAPNTDRPMTATVGQTDACGNTAVPSRFSPTGAFKPTCFIDANPLDGVFNGTLSGNVRRNSATRPYTVFTDFRVGRTFRLSERLTLDGTVDMFNIINRFNVADVNPLFTQAGTPTSAYDPRQFQFGLKLAW